MRARILAYERAGLLLKPPIGSRFTLTYGEILTAERLASIWGIRLHTLSSHPVRIPCHGDARIAIEDELRRRGVRIVDEYGALITPTLADFQAELMRDPNDVRQSSDDA